MILHLPVPPSRNVVTRHAGKYGRHVAKRRYQKAAWAAAVSQHRPTLDPPDHVTVSAHFRLYGPLRDEDGLDLKYVLDALRQHQTGNLGWRIGLYDQCGYFRDDSPAHLTLGAVTQDIDRGNVGLELTIEGTV